VTALFYLVDVDVALCPTWVIPKSFRSGRTPRPGETSWRDNKPTVVCAQQGDCLLFRSDVWHGGGLNDTAERHRFVCETVYGARKISQKFVSCLVPPVHLQSWHWLRQCFCTFCAWILRVAVAVHRLSPGGGYDVSCYPETAAAAWRTPDQQLWLAPSGILRSWMKNL
jgi:hypothetical protein